MEPLPASFKKKLKKNGVITLYLFGSRAHLKKVGPLSDYDCAALLNERVSPKRYFKIKLALIAELSQFFKNPQVDVVILNEAPPLLAMNCIDGTEIMFDVAPRSRVDFETKTLARYLDRLPYERRHLHHLLTSL